MNLVLMIDQSCAPSKLSRELPVPYEFFDCNKHYNQSTVFYYDNYLGRAQITQYLALHLEQGYRIIYDNKTEHWLQKQVGQSGNHITDLLEQYPNQHLFLTLGSQSATRPGLRVQAVPAWIWIRCYWYWRELGYQHYSNTNKHPNHKILCMINKPRVWRDRVWQQLDTISSMVLRSYVARGICMPNDSESDDRLWAVNTQWFDHTHMSLVCESSVCAADSEFSVSVPPGIFISEKTLKPLALQHPFLLIGTPGLLAELKRQGFETFPELFDESYDSIVDFDQRLTAIIQLARDIDPVDILQSQVQHKLKYNQSRLFDQDLIHSMIKQQLFDPIQEFLNE